MHASFLIFRVAGHLCAVPAREVREIVHIAATTQLPGQPSVLHGFLNLRGSALPVVELRGLFGEAASEPGLYAPFIVLAGDDSPLALLADTAEEVIEIDQGALQPLAGQHSFNDCAEGQFLSPQGTVVALSADRLLLAKERACVAALRAEAQRRLAEAGGLEA